MLDKGLLARSEKRKSQKGFSSIELIIVVALGAILGAAAFVSFSSTKKYAADDQTLKILDIIQEARQRAINQKSFMRVEFNNTNKQVRLIDENLPGSNTDDAVIKSININSNNVVVGVHPANVNLTNLPQPSATFAELVFANTNYPMSLNQSVFTLCFVKDGRVVQTGADGSCSSTNSIRGATVYVYSTPNAAGKAELTRALTVSGTTGAGNIFKCTTDSTGNCTSWVN